MTTLTHRAIPWACAGIGIIALAALWMNARPAPTRAPALPPPRRIPVIDADDPIRGIADAPLTIVEYSDFTCAACVDAQDTIAALRTTYGARLRIVWKDLPHRADARMLHTAAACAAAQGKFWEFHDTIFTRRATPNALRGIATELRIDRDAFDACLADPRTSATIDADIADAAALGIRGTPTFFIGSTRIVGAQSPAAFEALLNAPQTP